VDAPGDYGALQKTAAPFIAARICRQSILIQEIFNSYLV
jgi:hypothetical protein